MNKTHGGKETEYDGAHTLTRHSVILKSKEDIIKYKCDFIHRLVWWYSDHTNGFSPLPQWCLLKTKLNR